MSSKNNELSNEHSLEASIQSVLEYAEERFAKISKRLYKLSYWTGSKIFRRVKKHHKRLSLCFADIKVKLKKKASHAVNAVSVKKNNHVKKLHIPINRNAEFIKNSSDRLEKAFMEKAFNKGFFNGVCQSVVLFADFLKLNFSSLKTFANYAAPVAALVLFAVTFIAALVLFAVTFNHMSAKEYGLMVEYGGKNIGYIQSESVFVEAEKAARERAVYEEYVSPEENMPTYKLVSVKESMLSTQDMITEQIMSVSGNDLCVASFS